MLCLTEDFKNATIPQGEFFMIELGHNKAAGYVWNFSYDENKIKKVSEDFIPDNASEMEQIENAPPPLLFKKSRKRETISSPHPICHGKMHVIFQALVSGAVEIKASHEKRNHNLADRFRIFKLNIV